MKATFKEALFLFNFFEEEIRLVFHKPVVTSTLITINTLKALTEPSVRQKNIEYNKTLLCSMKSGFPL
jgi:hypothetical protein